MLLPESIFYGLVIIINVIGITANLLQIMIGLFKTPDSFKSYVVLLVNSGICDLVACATALFVQERIIPTGRQLFFIPEGPCQHFGGNICHLSYSVTLHCYTHNMWSLMVCFIFRLFAIRSVKISRLQLGLILLLFYLLSLIQMFLFYFGFENSPDLVYRLSALFPEYYLDKRLIYGSVDIFGCNVLYVTLHMSLPILPIYVIIFLCRQKSLKSLQRHDNNMSNKTQILHQQLLRALAFQATLPALCLLFLFLYSLAAFDLLHGPYLEKATALALGIVPALSPVVRLYYIRPYRSWIAKYILRQKDTKIYVWKTSHT